jgi:hypothetical protein
MSGGNSSGVIGQYIVGHLDAHNIPRKCISAQTGMHESTLSRKITGAEDFKERELILIGIAIGKALYDPKRSGQGA